MLSDLNFKALIRDIKRQTVRKLKTTEGDGSVLSFLFIFPPSFSSPNIQCYIASSTPSTFLPFLSLLSLSLPSSEMLKYSTAETSPWSELCFSRLFPIALYQTLQRCQISSNHKNANVRTQAGI